MIFFSWIQTLLEIAEKKTRTYAKNYKTLNAGKILGILENSWFAIFFGLSITRVGENIISNSFYHFLAFPVSGALSWMATGLDFIRLAQNLYRDYKDRRFSENTASAALDFIFSFAKSVVITAAVILAFTAATVLGGVLAPAFFILGIGIATVNNAAQALWNVVCMLNHLRKGEYEQAKARIWPAIDRTVFTGLGVASMVVIGGLLIAAPHLSMPIISVIAAVCGVVLTGVSIAYIVARTAIDIARTPIEDDDVEMERLGENNQPSLAPEPTIRSSLLRNQPEPSNSWFSVEAWKNSRVASLLTPSFMSKKPAKPEVKPTYTDTFHTVGATPGYKSPAP